MLSNEYLQAAEVLPGPLRRIAEQFSAEAQTGTEEFRLRIGKPMSLLIGAIEVQSNSAVIEENDLRNILEVASEFSVHTVLSQMRSGFLVIKGGHRIGLCGEIVMKDGQVHSYRRLSSMSIRIARPISGLGAEILPEICTDGYPDDTLILAPPGAGKTTLLRELVKLLSNGEGVLPQRVGLADERREISALWNGRCQLDVGQRTDVAVDCPKHIALELLLRGMNPQVLAMDEITAERDIDALAQASGCGVKLLATAHGGELRDLNRRPLYRGILEQGLFSRIVLLKNHGGARKAEVKKIS